MSRCCRRPSPSSTGCPAGLGCGLRRARDFAQQGLDRELEADRRYAGLARDVDVAGHDLCVPRRRPRCRTCHRAGRSSGWAARAAAARRCPCAARRAARPARLGAAASPGARPVAARLATYRSYSALGEVAAGTARPDAARPARHQGAGRPGTAVLGRLIEHATQATRVLRGVIPPPDLAAAHALLQSACQMAGAAAETRSKAIQSGDMATAWNASSAAADRSCCLAARGTSSSVIWRPPPAVITSRDVRLVRAVSLHDYQRALAGAACDGGAAGVRATAVLVPTRAAALQLQRTSEHLLLEAGGAIVLPDSSPARSSTNGSACRRSARRLAIAFDREVMLQAGAHEAITDGTPAPFHLRPALLGRCSSSTTSCGGASGGGRFRAVARRRARTPRSHRSRRGAHAAADAVPCGGVPLVRTPHAGRRGLDEHAFRTGCLRRGVPPRYGRVIVAVSDRIVGAGRTVARRFRSLSRAAGIERIEVVATEAQLAAGSHVRVHDLLPGIEEMRVPPAEVPLDDRVLVVPPTAEPALSHQPRS